jgi:hypothetical protein
MADTSNRTIPAETLGVELSNYTVGLIEVRLGRLMIELTQMMRQAYEQKFAVTNAGGASSALMYEVTRTAQFISATIGASKANSYLQFLEYGVRGTEGGAGLYSRSHMPPVSNIYEWVKKAGLSPREEQKHSKDPLKSIAWAVATHILKFGTPALHIIELVLTKQTQRIQQVLAGA